MFDSKQFRQVIIQPSLIAINLYSLDAEELLVATMAQETLGGTYVAQVNGPACGVFEMEPITYDDLWDRSINSIFKTDILKACQYDSKPPAEHMIWNLRFATLMARMFYYYRDKGPLPSHTDIQAIWTTYKRYWNTSKGAATENAFMANYNRFVGHRTT